MSLVIGRRQSLLGCKLLQPLSNFLIKKEVIAINYEKGIPVNLNITLRHFKNIKASQPALFSITANGKNPNNYDLCSIYGLDQ
jgi:hypothetical protein